MSEKGGIILTILGLLIFGGICLYRQFKIQIKDHDEHN
jgi:hypothetical protein